VTDQQLIPPPELVKKWWKDAQQADYSDGLPCWLNYVATQAARWGADQELDACCEHFEDHLRDGIAKDLRAARRPKPPSLKEQALAALSEADQGLNKSEWQQCSNTIRRALEALPDD
jgi:hypothetical protein